MIEIAKGSQPCALSSASQGAFHGTFLLPPPSAGQDGSVKAPHSPENVTLKMEKKGEKNKIRRSRQIYVPLLYRYQSNSTVPLSMQMKSGNLEGVEIRLSGRISHLWIIEESSFTTRTKSHEECPCQVWIPRRQPPALPTTPTMVIGVDMFFARVNVCRRSCTALAASFRSMSR